MRSFTMKVRDTFHFKNGVTAFIGPLDTEVEFIPPCDCEIVVGDEVKASLRIDGEMILENQMESTRAIATSQPLDLASRGIGRGGFEIRPKSGERR